VWTQGGVTDTGEVLYDGDSQVVRASSSALYNLRSTVLGGSVVAEVSNTGQRFRGFVLAEGQGVLATQNGDNSVLWEHRDPAEQSIRVADNSGLVVDQREETTSGAKIEPQDPYPTNPNFTGADSDGQYPFVGTVGKPATGCVRDGILIPDCSWIFVRIHSMELSETAARREFLGYSVWIGGHSLGSRMIEGHWSQIYENWGDAAAEADTLRSNTFARNWRVDDNWFQTPYLFSRQTQTPKPIDPRQVTRRLLSTQELALLKEHFNGMIGKEECSKFLEDFLKKAEEDNPKYKRASGNIKTLFESVAFGGGFWSAFGASYNTIGGDIKKNSGAIYFTNNPRFYSIGPVNRAAETAFLNGTFRSMAQTVLHELFHHAGFSDRALANTAARWQGETVSFANTWEGTLAASKYWDTLLQEHCH
jgi:hypothetical protein